MKFALPALTIIAHYITPIVSNPIPVFNSIRLDTDTTFESKEESISFNVTRYAGSAAATVTADGVEFDVDYEKFMSYWGLESGNDTNFEIFGLTDQFTKPFTIKESHYWSRVEKLFANDDYYDFVSKNTGLKRTKIANRFLKFLKSHSTKNIREETIHCKEVEPSFVGLCKNENGRILYHNNDRAERHLVRSIGLPFAGAFSTLGLYAMQFRLCNFPFYAPIEDYFICQIAGDDLYYTQLIWSALVVLGYQEFTDQPFAPVAVKLVKLYRKMGFNMKAYSAVSNSGQVCTIDDMPTDFDLSYFYINYGVEGGRNASMAIFPGNKDGEIGFSIISKPWEKELQFPSIVDSPYHSREKLHWKYILKVDAEEFRYVFDQMSPEELYHQVSRSMSFIKDYRYLGGELFSADSEVYFNINDPQVSDEENDKKHRQEVELIGIPDEEIFERDFNGLKLKCVLQENAEHTINWDEW